MAAKNGVQKRRFRSKDEWRDLLRDWRESGLSALSWCKIKGISTSVFGRWRHKLEGHDSEALIDRGSAFIPIQMDRSLSSSLICTSPQLDIVLSSGHRIQVQGLGESQVMTLIQQLII